MSPSPALKALALAAITLSLGCFVEVSSTGSSSDSPASGASADLSSMLEAQFEMKAAGVSASIRCPAGLSGSQGNQLHCSGETSDGFTLEIAVLERGNGAFRWDVIESHPIR